MSRLNGHEPPERPRSSARPPTKALAAAHGCPSPRRPEPGAAGHNRISSRLSSLDFIVSVNTVKNEGGWTEAVKGLGPWPLQRTCGQVGTTFLLPPWAASREGKVSLKTARALTRNPCFASLLNVRINRNLISKHCDTYLFNCHLYKLLHIPF